MKNRKVDIRMSSKMVGDICTFYRIEKPSEALQRCIKDAFLKHTMHTQNRRHWSPAQTLKLVEQDNAPKEERVSVYLPDMVMEFLQRYYCRKAFITNAVAVRCCVYDVLHNAVTNQTLRAHDKVFYMVGQKNPLMQEFLNECFEDIHSIYRIDGYAEPFTGSANVLLHSNEFDVEFINDNSTDLVNLLRIIRDYPYELKTELLSLEISKTTFDNLKTELHKVFRLKSSKSALIQRAVAFYFCRYSSHYGKGESYREISIDAYMRKLDCIYPLSQRLQCVEIKKSDALYFSNILTEDAEHFLVYFDAPYICSEEHYKQNNAKHQAFSSHIALRNRVQELRYRHICILSYRITASKSMKKKGISDVMLQRKLDFLYLNRDFHYKLKQFNNAKGQIEILLSTVPFTGSRPYTLPLAEMEVK